MAPVLDELRIDCVIVGAASQASVNRRRVGLRPDDDGGRVRLEGLDDGRERIAEIEVCRGGHERKARRDGQSLDVGRCLRYDVLRRDVEGHRRLLWLHLHLAGERRLADLVELVHQLLDGGDVAVGPVEVHRREDVRARVHLRAVRPVEGERAGVLLLGEVLGVVDLEVLRPQSSLRVFEPVGWPLHERGEECRLPGLVLHDLDGKVVRLDDGRGHEDGELLLASEVEDRLADDVEVLDDRLGVRRVFVGLNVIECRDVRAERSALLSSNSCSEAERLDDGPARRKWLPVLADDGREDNLRRGPVALAGGPVDGQAALVASL